MIGSPELDGNYPTDKTLKTIMSWPVDDFKGLMEFCCKAWNWGSDYFHIGYDKEGKQRVEAHTGGWSGNEDIIAALQENTIFWVMCWRESKRGGHYVFEVK